MRSHSIDSFDGAASSAPKTSTLQAHWLRLVLSLLCACAGMSVLGAAPAGAAVLTVRSGQSIQQAVDAAKPGDTIEVEPGTYAGYITIAKDGITLRGAGSGATGSRLVPGGAPTDCDSGICVMGQLDDSAKVVRPVRGVRVSRFAVSGFPGSGVLAVGDIGSVFDHIVAAGNGNFGITSVFSSGDRYLSNVAFSNDFAGFQIADSPQADAQLSGNTAYHNRFGVFVIGASQGLITDNELRDNCSGLGFFDAGPNGRTSSWVAARNVIEHNDRSCPALPEGDPMISGNGIVILGGKQIVIVHNEVRSNQPAAGTRTPLAGGIVVMTIPSPAHTAPTDDLIVDNVVCDNLPANLVYDGTGSGVRFLPARSIGRCNGPV